MSPNGTKRKKNPATSDSDAALLTASFSFLQLRKCVVVSSGYIVCNLYFTAKKKKKIFSKTPEHNNHYFKTTSIQKPPSCFKIKACNHDSLSNCPNSFCGCCLCAADASSSHMPWTLNRLKRQFSGSDAGVPVRCRNDFSLARRDRSTAPPGFLPGAVET